MITSDIKNFKCFNQLRNGVDFSQNTGEFTTDFVGNIGERVKVTYDVEFEISASGDNLLYEKIDDFTYLLASDDINWLDEGFAIFDVIAVYGGSITRGGGIFGGTTTLQVILLGAITEISEDGSRMKVQFSVANSLEQANIESWRIEVNMLNRADACIFSYGLIENEEEFNTVSKVTNEEQGFYSELELNVEKTFITKGPVKGWEADILKATTTQDSIGIVSTPKVIVSFEHEFIVQPYGTIELQENLETGEIPSNLAGDNSFKYVARFQFRRGLNSINTNVDFNAETRKGEVGFFGESFNGLNNDYEVLSVQYQDANTLANVDSILILSRTLITITAQRNTGNTTANDFVGAYVSYLPETEEEYINQKENFDNIFLYDGLSAVANGVPVVGTGIAKSLTVTQSMGNQVVIELEVEYTASQQLRLTRDNRYLLWIQNELEALTPDDSDRVANIVEINNFEQAQFIPNLINWTKFNVLQHDQTTGDVEKAFEIWNEDGLLIDFEFNLDLSKEAVLDDLTFKLVAFKSSENKLFELDSFIVPLNSIFSGGIQEIEIDETRGYLLKDGNEFNFVKLTTGNKIGDLQYYSGQIGQKIKWQEWIENLGVDTVFYDKTKAQNNLNFKSSNYSGLEGYQIKVMAESNLTGIDQLGRDGVGFNQNFSNDLPVYNYGVSNDGGVSSGLVKLLDPDTLEDTEGVILRDKNTLFQIIWSVTDINLTDAYGINRIQKSGSIGDDKEELSSLLSNPNNQILKGIDANNLLELRAEGLDIISECLIDNEKLEAGVQYDLSGTIKKITGFGAYIFTIDTTQAGSANDTFELPLSVALNCTIDWGDTNTDPAIVGINSHTYAAPGVYTITITGDDVTVDYNNSGDKSKYLDTLNFGILILDEFSFYGCNNATFATATDIPRTTTDLERLFRSNSVAVFNSSINNWDVSSVTNMKDLFFSCVLFNQDLNNWNVSSVTTMQSMFRSANAFNGNISTWDVSSVTNFTEMFEFATSFNQDLNGWNVSSATTFDQMFSNASIFNGNISSWNTSNVQFFSSMFRGATVFNQDISGWNTSSAISLALMFQNASAFNQNIGGWNVANVTSLSSTFQAATSFNQNIGGWNVANVNTLFRAFTNATVFNQDISGWNVSNVTSFESTFSDATDFNQNISLWDYSSATTFVQFLDDSGLSTANYDALLIAWDAQTIPLSNFNIGVSNLTYTLGGAAETARTNLIGKGWVFIGDSGI